MLLDSYEVGELVARSGRTIVRRARRVADGLPVVIKTPAREYPTLRELSQLEFEHRLLRKVRGPGVIGVVALEREQGRLALVLEDFGGERLRTGEAERLPLGVFFSVAVAAAKALGEVHAKNVIHKDINPRNILLNPVTREVKLIDFSLASELNGELSDLKSTAQLEGTVQYISPEQTGRMNRDLDYRSDYYSLGITFYEILTGALPFSAVDVLGFVHCHLSKPAPNPRDLRPEVPAALASVVAKLMAKSPNDRYQSARGLGRDLEECQRLWADTGDAAVFPLGRHDVPERFRISQKLVGRKAEAETLLSVFDGASQGPAALLLIGGYSGIGKSSLIREIHRSVVAKRAAFIAAKFDQLERHSPYGAWAQALRELVKQILAEPEDRLREWRESLLAALHANGSVILGLVPELEQIIGPQPRVADLPAREAHDRIRRVFRDFIKVVATGAHPLVVFFDDMQWTDDSTPQLLVDLLGDAELRHVLIIGAYRDNEVGEGHVLRIALANLKEQRPAAVRQLHLGPLPESALNEIIAETLYCDPAVSAPLAAHLFQKTGGNPYFLNELLALLHREEAIRFSAGDGVWIWDSEKVARAAVSLNVVDLMVSRLARLPRATLDCLRVAACLGHEFDLAMVARVANQPSGAVAAGLWTAVEERLLFPRGDGYRLLRRDGADDGAELAELSVRYQFPHDRVLQAVYSLLQDDERAETHLRIGHLILAAIPLSERAEKVFDFIDHLNLGRRLIASPDERRELADWNFVAGKRARLSAAYATAVGYLETCLGTLSQSEWTAQRPHYFECSRMRVECVFLSGQVERASALCEELFDRAPDRLAAASVFCLKAAILEHGSKLHEAVETIRQGLRSLDVNLPDDHAEIDREIGAGLGKMQAHLARTPIEELAYLPAMTDDVKVATMDLLFQIIPPASQMHPPLFILAELIIFDFALTYGTTAASSKNFVDCGIVLNVILKDSARAYRMGKVAFVLLDRHAPTPLESSVNFVFGCFVSHWGAHYQEGLDALARSYQRGIELGDVQHAAYAAVHRALRFFFAGRPLSECRTQADRAAAFSLEARAVGQATAARIVQRALSQLCAAEDERASLEPADSVFIDEIRATGNAHWLLVLGQTQTLVHVILGDSGAAADWDAFAATHIAMGNGTFPVPDYYLMRAILRARRLRGMPAGDEREVLLGELLEAQAQLKTFAEASPANFEHKYKLASAELSRARGEPTDEVLRLYQETLAAAGDDVLHLRALVNELQAEFWRDRGHPQLAKACLFEAYYLYRRWGARAKLERMDRQHPTWYGGTSSTPFALEGWVNPATSTSAASASALDLASAIKATHAISSEVRPEKLFAVLMDAIIENAGAQHGSLIVRTEGGDLAVAARASIASRTPIGRPVALSECTDVALDVVRYVARTHETVVQDDAREGSYRDDLHVQRDNVKSILCMPVLHQGQLTALLYVENNVATHAFTPERLSVLRVIAGQAAISIANAALYESLEQKVTARTRELTERNRDVVALLNSMQQGVFTIDDKLLIQPQYSAHLQALVGTRDIAGKDCLELLFLGSNVGGEARKTMRSALQFSFGVPLALAEANLNHMLRAFERPDASTDEGATFEVEWSPIAGHDDVVRKILVTLRDVSMLEHLKVTVARNARELDIVGQILDAGVERFQRFCASARTVMDDARAALQAPAPLPRVALDRAFRDIHTVKGNARMLGLSHISDAVHAAEEFLHHRREQPEAAAQGTPGAAIDAVLDRIRDYERVCERKLGDALRPSDRLDERVWSDVASHLGSAHAGTVSAAEALSGIERALRRARAVPLSQVVSSTAKMLPVLAQELGKIAPVVDTERTDLWLTAPWARAMADAFVHAFQNSIDHGLEATEERRVRGKGPQGKIRVRAGRTANGIQIRIADDGRGLDIGKLRHLGGDVAETDEQVAASVFGAGVSTATAVTPISGRGVGLDAVRSLVRGQGGDVLVAFTAEEADGYRPFELVFALPEDAALVGN